MHMILRENNFCYVAFSKDKVREREKDRISAQAIVIRLHKAKI